MVSDAPGRIARRPPGRIAFFDMDRTLLAVNSGSLWIRSELLGGHLRVRDALRGWVWIVGYHLGYTDLQPVLRDAVALLRDTPEAVIRERTRRFWESEVRWMVRPGARAALARHRAAGDRLVLLTTSSPYLSAPVVQDLALDDFVCSEFEVRDGSFTGVPREPLCYGPGKLQRARDYAAHAGVPLAECAFHTDSLSDLPVLEAVGLPVAVNPDPRLRRVATARGWRVEDWGG